MDNLAHITSREGRTSGNQGSQSGYLPHIDVLRFFAIASVVAMHVALTQIWVIKASEGTTPMIYSAVYSASLLFRMYFPCFFFLAVMMIARSSLKSDYTTLRMWSRRFAYIILPYIAWSLIYMSNPHHTNPVKFPSSVGELITILVKGTADHHFYFIPRIVQVILVAPFLVMLMRRVSQETFKKFLVLAFGFGLMLLVLENPYVMPDSIRPFLRYIAGKTLRIISYFSVNDMLIHMFAIALGAYAGLNMKTFEDYVRKTWIYYGIATAALLGLMLAHPNIYSPVLFFPDPPAPEGIPWISLGKYAPLIMHIENYCAIFFCYGLSIFICRLSGESGGIIQWISEAFTKLAAKIGSRSYGIYLNHILIHRILERDVFFHNLSFLRYAIMLALTLALSYCLTVNPRRPRK